MLYIHMYIYIYMMMMMMSCPRSGGVFKIYDEPESPNEGPCLRYRMSRNRQVMGHV